jgi:signal transduction histidine kinase/tetratricopeptide (TPR) repeat protein
MNTGAIQQAVSRGERTSSLLLGGKFLKTQYLHQQGALQLWQGTDLSTGAPVVVKTASLEALQVGAFERMLRDDAVLRDLRSPWLSPPLASGLEGELLFRVRPCASQATLEARLAMGPLSVKEALQLGRGILRALREAHAQGVLHRHLAPSCVVVDPERGLEAVRLIDFGLALEDLREPGLVALPLSAIQYLSPEQLGLVTGEPGPVSDLYAVGLMLFEGLAGVRPFQGASLGELLRQHLRTVPELRALGLSVPRALEQVVQHLLCEEPQERYQSAAAALADLEAITLELERGISEPSVVVGRSEHHQRLTEPVFMGRAAELLGLEAPLSAAGQGHGGLVLVEGESGGGKTMLLDELERRALARGACVFRGQAIDRGAPQPLQTFLGFLSELGPAAESLPALAQALRALGNTKLGEALSACPQLKTLVTATAPALLGPERPKEGCPAQRLAKVISAMGDARTPALVLLDDCQWSDGLTLRTLALLGEQPGVERFVTVVAAFRKEEVPEAHPLRQMASMHHVCLAPFTGSDLRNLAESMAGPLPEEAMELVVQRSEGNPFMAVAMVRGLVECGALEPMASGWRVEPKRLAEVSSSRRAAALLLRRLVLFSEQTRALLIAGAVLGRAFDVGLVAVLARQRPDQAVVALEEARRRHLLWADASKSRYTFTHDRIREALLENLPVEEGRALHLTAALELERQAPERSFELAWHFEAAGELQRAWPYALRSAEAARRNHAPDLAERYYRLADAGAVGADGATRMAILEGLGDVLLIQPALEEAERSYTRAQAFATSRLDRARLEGRRGEVALRQERLPAAAGLMERALGLLGRKVPVSPLAHVLCLLWEVLLRMSRSLWPKRPSRRSPVMEGEVLLAARLYVWLTHIYWFRGGWPVAAGWALLRGLTIAERYAPTPELAKALSHQGALPLVVQTIPRVPRFLADRALARSQKRFQRAIALREAFGEVYEHGTTLAIYQFVLLQGARYEESIEAGRQALHLLQHAGAGNEWYAGFAQYSLGLALFLKGDLTSAVELGQAMYHQHKERGDGLMCARGLDLWSMASGGQVPVEAIAAERARLASDGDSHSLMRQALLLRAEALRLLRAGEFTQAMATLEQVVGCTKSWLRLPLFHGWTQAQIVMALRRQAAQVPAHFFSRRAELLNKARAEARKALRHAPPSQETLAPTLRELGLIAAMEGRNARARRCFDRSLAIAERLGMHYERAQTLLARAELGAELGWPDAAQDAAAGEQALRPMRAALEPVTAAEPQASLSLVDRFPRILEAGRAITSALTRGNVLASVREAAVGLLRGEACVLFEATPEGETAWPFVQRARELRRPVVPSTEELESAGEGLARSALCAPILVRGQVAALFCVTNHKLAGAFGSQEVRIAEFIATLAGAALENAQGFAEVNALSEERGRLYAQAQAALRKRDEFLAVASHELRTPFTPMSLYLQGLINALRNPAKAGSLASWVTKLETANQRLKRMARLVEDLFDVSRLAQGQLALRLGEVDLAALTAEAVDRWKDELGRVQCDYTLEAPAPVVGHWDALRLEQVIDNLLGNAAKYGPGKPIILSVKREGAVARLTVQDRGMGIAPEDQVRIFERFERAVSENYGGFGLGLWISQEVVRAHRGRIFLESVPGQGATFTVELPL